MTIDTKHLRELAAKASPGPWFVCRQSNDDGTVDIETGRIAQNEWPPAQKCEYGTAEFIAVANPETIIELLDTIDSFRSEPPIQEGWRPIETAPNEGDFLVYMPSEPSKVQAAWRNKNGVFVIGGAFAFDISKPTYWMPMPPAPQAGAIQKEGE